MFDKPLTILPSYRASPLFTCLHLAHHLCPRQVTGDLTGCLFPAPRSSLAPGTLRVICILLIPSSSNILLAMGLQGLLDRRVPRLSLPHSLPSSCFLSKPALARTPATVPCTEGSLVTTGQKCQPSVSHTTLGLTPSKAFPFKDFWVYSVQP